MRLIRLSTTDTNCLFDNEFDSDIIIKPKSKIALQNVSFEVNKDKLTINSDNDKITVAITSSNIKEIQLEHGEYDNNTIQTLLDDIQDKLNAILDSNLNKDIGIEWNTLINIYGNVEIQYRIGKYNSYDEHWVLNNVSKYDSGNAIDFASNNTTAVSTNDNNAYLTSILSRGCGVFRCKIDELIDNAGSSAENGFIMGLCDVNPDTLANNTITQDHWKMAIQVGKTTDDYQIYIDGVLQPPTGINIGFISATNPNNHTLEIVLEESTLRANIYGPISTTEIGSIQVTLGDDLKLYPFFIFRGQADEAIVNNIRFTASPYVPILNFDNQYHENTLQHNNEPANPPRNQNTNQYFEFESSTLPTFLGYKYSRYPLTGYQNTERLLLPAENKYETIETNELYVVETLNLSLISYDGLTHHKRSILATIPKNQVNTVVSYEPPEKNFIDIDNTYDINLRNLSCIVRNNDLSLINTKGLSSMTLFIKNPDE